MKKQIFILMAVLTGFTSCQKDVDFDKLSSDLIVSTNRDKGAAFNSYSTYFISDTIINLGGTGTDTVWVGPAVTQLVAQVKTNMNNRGYTFAARNNKPQLGLKLGVVKVVNIDVYPGWYTGYAGWFPYYWGGYYPYYYPWTTVYAYDTGTIILDTYDLKNAKTNGQYKAIWNLSAFGALGSDSNGNLSRGIKAIDQGFAQSPYVRAN